MYNFGGLKKTIIVVAHPTFDFSGQIKRKSYFLSGPQRKVGQTPQKISEHFWERDIMH